MGSGADLSAWACLLGCEENLSDIRVGAVGGIKVVAPVDENSEFCFERGQIPPPASSTYPNLRPGSALTTAELSRWIEKAHIVQDTRLMRARLGAATRHLTAQQPTWSAAPPAPGMLVATCSVIAQSGTSLAPQTRE